MYWVEIMLSMIHFAVITCLQICPVLHLVEIRAIIITPYRPAAEIGFILVI